MTEDPEISYHFDWSLNPSGSTRSAFRKPTKPRENYKLSSLWPILNKVIIYTLNLPKDIITRLIKLGSSKESISDVTTPQESSMSDLKL